jgi:gliding motility-associated-like protein
MKKLLPVLAFILLFTNESFATHNRAGEITYTHVSGSTYNIQIVTYTKATSIADRPKLAILWGDGDSDTLERVNGPVQGTPGSIPEGEIIGNDMKKNIYLGTHTYPGPGTYLINFEDPNRNAGVVNIPNSVSIPFYIETMLIINPFIGTNSSPILYQPPIEEACVGKIFLHNPNAFDPDGDSLSYKLVANKGAGGAVVPGYTLPPASISLTLDPVTGDFIWNTPTMIGEFNVAILIEEWRNGQRIGYVTRDMQINVHPNCSNDPPHINPVADYCVEAGEVVSFNVTAVDPNPGDVITLSATGAPFSLPISPAFFQSVSQTGTVTGTFTWNTHCSHVRINPYQVMFKAQDNGQISLIDLERTDIKVVGPSPKNPMATPLGSNIHVSWDQSVCSAQVVGYDIYRRNGFINFVPANCETGVPAYTGYTKVGSVSGAPATTFIDNNNGAGLSPGIEYCYMIVAIFSNSAESYASLETCTQLKKDVPVITNVSVETTDAPAGEIYVAWSKPTEFDTVQLPGPYRYEVYRSPGFFGASFSQVVTFNDLNDTTFNDVGLDTKNQPWSYRILFYNDTLFVGQTQVASSIFLSVTPTDNRNILTWEEHVPWINNYDSLSQYRIYRKDPGATDFNEIGMSSTNSYTDFGLVNGEEYCYYIRSMGQYSVPGFIDPILNFSQENCGIPVDNEPPCDPRFNILSDCDREENTLVWTQPTLAPCPDDIMHFNIYFKQFLDDDLQLIATISSADDTVKFVHSGSLIGCYFVTAVDSLLNESPVGEPVCVGTGDFPCDPQYNLPNVFSPNGDGFNDIFHPCDNTTDPIQQLTCKPYRFVRDVHITFYNRWGKRVFETTDIDINWNGRNNDGGELAAGTYFYVAQVNFIKLSGLEQRVLKGFVQLIK